MIIIERAKPEQANKIAILVGNLLQEIMDRIGDLYSMFGNHLGC
jgi:hypothetical protein